jgi:hypothetical protein
MMFAHVATKVVGDGGDGGDGIFFMLLLEPKKNFLVYRKSWKCRPCRPRRPHFFVSFSTKTVSTCGNPCAAMISAPFPTQQKLSCNKKVGTPIF